MIPTTSIENHFYFISCSDTTISPPKPKIPISFFQNLELPFDLIPGFSHHLRYPCEIGSISIDILF
jgi:hypothetical protein